MILYEAPTKKCPWLDKQRVANLIPGLAPLSFTVKENTRQHVRTHLRRYSVMCDKFLSCTATAWELRLIPSYPEGWLLVKIYIGWNYDVEPCSPLLEAGLQPSGTGLMLSVNYISLSVCVRTIRVVARCWKNRIFIYE